MNRKNSIDFLRVICAMAVVVIHTVTATTLNSQEPSDTLIHNMNVIHNLCRWSIPIFFMISGYCVLQKEECTYRYCFRHVIKYAAALATVGLFYAMIEQVFLYKKMNIEIVITSVQNVLAGNSWAHMWFVYSIIGIYLVMPLVHALFKQNTNNDIIFTGILFLFTVLIPALSKVVHVGIDFPIGGYLFYVCFGGLVSKYAIKRWQSVLAIVGVVFTLFYIVLRPEDTVLEYRSITISILAMGLFILISGIKLKPYKWIMLISVCTWGIYLIHPFFINLTLKFFEIDLLQKSPYVNLSVFAIIVFMISYLCTWILRKIPFVSKIF